MIITLGHMIEGHVDRRTWVSDMGHIDTYRHGTIDFELMKLISLV